jgi:ABC-type histidine transport system ATPase subunit
VPAPTASTRIGLDIDVTDLIAAKLGVTAELVPVTSANHIPYLQTNEVNLVVPTLDKMSFARKVSDRVVVMHARRIHEIGPPAQIFGAPQTPELRQFLAAFDG